MAAQRRFDYSEVVETATKAINELHSDRAFQFTEAERDPEAVERKAHEFASMFCDVTSQAETTNVH